MAEGKNGGASLGPGIGKVSLSPPKILQRRGRRGEASKKKRGKELVLRKGRLRNSKKRLLSSRGDSY